MTLTFDEFKRQWKESGESDSDLMLDVAWRRYQHIQSKDLEIKPEHAEPSLNELRRAFEPLLAHPDICDSIITYNVLTVPANTIPWLPTGIFVDEDRPVSCFATGRTWRSKLLDMYLPPQFALWYRIGVNGEVFNSTRDTRTFKCIPGQAGELYLAPHFPGQFASRTGGRVQGDLTAYEKAEGSFQVLIILWKEGMIIGEDVYQKLVRIYQISKDIGQFDPYGLISTALSRLSSNYFERRFPANWSLLWFLGMSEVFTQEEEEVDFPQRSSEPTKTDDLELSHPLLSPVPEDSIATLTLRPTNSLSQTHSAISPNPTKIIRCVPNHNVGILQKDLVAPLPFQDPTTVSWLWNIPSLPSRLREDTTLTHDYLSIAFEFNNGRDLTYTWSWELEEGFGYWCPLPTWADREYHIVIRSGTERLGEWIQEKRNLWSDYVEYINEGDTSRTVPQQIVKVWLIAGNRWQRHRGEMLIKAIEIEAGPNGEKVL